MFHRIHFTALKQYTLVHRGVCTSTPIRGEWALLLLHCCGIWRTHVATSVMSHKTCTRDQRDMFQPVWFNAETGNSFTLHTQL